MSSTQPTTVGVVGATGTTGRRVVDQLGPTGLAVRGLSRRTTPRFDWTDESTYGPALAGVDALYLVPPEAPTSVGAFLAAAGRSGVERLVLLSARNPAQSGDDHIVKVEQQVKGGRWAWTILQPSWFVQNFTEGFFRAPLAEDGLRLPTGEGREPFIDVEDIAAVAVAALTRPGHEGRTYELSGPDLLTFAEAVDRLAAAVGRPLRFTAVTDDEFAAEMAAAGTPAPVVEVLSHLFRAIRAGDNAHLSDGVTQALGRPPVAFDEAVRRAAPDW